MLYHLSLVARPYLDTGRVGDIWWWLTETPLKLATAGTEAVLVFFVLSGLVVALPTLRDGFSWPAFLGARFVRLYLPVWGSLALAAAVIAILPRNPAAATAGSWLDEANSTHVTLPQLLGEASLWRVTYDLNNVLWSLRWELVFCLCLPLLIALASLVKNHWLPAAAAATALMITGRLTDVDALVYLPVFFLGTLMAVRMPELRSWAATRSTRTWAVVTSTSLALLIGSWLARHIEGTVGGEVLWALSGVGAAGLIIVVLGSPLAQRMLSARVPRWLGRVSFSLYLVQAPVIATVAFALGDGNWLLIAAISIPATLGLSWLFHLGVERPAHLLARATQRVIGSRSPARELADQRR
jgi:peptidoglycan/LPS O-acetylase OafA/YrhL